MTSSTVPENEIHSILFFTREGQPQVTSTTNLVKFGRVVFESEHRHTDILMAIILTLLPTESKVITLKEVHFEVCVMYSAGLIGFCITYRSSKY